MASRAILVGQTQICVTIVGNMFRIPGEKMQRKSTWKPLAYNSFFWHQDRICIGKCRRSLQDQVSTECIVPAQLQAPKTQAVLEQPMVASFPPKDSKKYVLSLIIPGMQKKNWLCLKILLPHAPFSGKWWSSTGFRGPGTPIFNSDCLKPAWPSPGSARGAGQPERRSSKDTLPRDPWRTQGYQTKQWLGKFRKGIPVFLSHT